MTRSTGLGIARRGRSGSGQDVRGRRILAVDGRLDPVLHHIAPLGLAAAAGTSLVVDLDPESPGYGGTATVADLLAGGVRHEHLVPARSGVAVLSSGGSGIAEAADLLEILASRWPVVVVRTAGPVVDIPTVPVVPMYPRPLGRRPAGPAVYQCLGPLVRPPGPGIALPAIGRGRIADLIQGRVDPRWRWVRAWREVWELPWP